MALNTKNFTYRGILKSSYESVKNNKFLWIYGFFAAAIGTVGEFNYMFKNYSEMGSAANNVIGLKAWYESGVLWKILENAKAFFISFPWQALMFFLMLAVIFLVILWLAIVSQIALFNATSKLYRNKKTSYTEGYNVGNKFFLPVLILNIVIKFLLYVLFAIISLPLLTWFLVGNSAWGGVLFVMLLFFIFVPLTIIISFILKYSVAFIVLKGQSVWPAVKSAWQLFKKYWIISLETAFIMLVLGILVGFGILVSLGLASVPFILIGVFALFFGIKTGFSIAILLGMITWFLVIAVIGSAFVAFQYSTWTILFLDLVDNKAESKLVRWFGKISYKKLA